MNATATMTETESGGSSHFTEAVLHPGYRNESYMIDKTESLYKKANELCFIASSVIFLCTIRTTCKAVAAAALKLFTR